MQAVHATDMSREIEGVSTSRTNQGCRHGIICARRRLVFTHSVSVLNLNKGFGVSAAASTQSCVRQLAAAPYIDRSRSYKAGDLGLLPPTPWLYTTFRRSWRWGQLAWRPQRIVLR